MAQVVSVKFKEDGKSYYFNPLNFELKENDRVIVDTVRGMECGIVSSKIKEINNDLVVQPLRNVLRIATHNDMRIQRENKVKEQKAFDICIGKIEHHGLDMKLIDVEYTFDNSKILFYFTSDGRVDFRELVKDLANVFKTRIELRQIGVRDEAKMIGGLGICGRPFCCSTFLTEFQPVSIKMAKEQGLSLNPTKISGTCGRLMCCLKYEQKSYESLGKITPRVGSKVLTDDGKGKVIDSDVLSGKLRVLLDSSSDFSPKVYHRENVKLLIDNSKARRK